MSIVKTIIEKLNIFSSFMRAQSELNKKQSDINGITIRQNDLMMDYLFDLEKRIEKLERES